MRCRLYWVQTATMTAWCAPVVITEIADRDKDIITELSVEKEELEEKETQLKDGAGEAGAGKRGAGRE